MHLQDTEINKRFKGLKIIGKGVSSTVYSAFDSKRNAQVALKVLNPHLHADTISLERFRREIQITRYINSSSIVQMYDLITHKSNIYIIMELIEGSTLKEYIHLNAPLKPQRALKILTSLLETLSACHKKNVIHRDLKPQNIMIDKNDQVKILDFGISRMTSLSDLTQTGTSLGSPEYMAPELFATNAYDPRTDIYSLGIIAFELLAGKLPFNGDSLSVLYNEHLTKPVPALKSLNADIEDLHQSLVEKMLEKKAFQRYQSIDEILYDIKNQEILLKRIPELEKRKCINCKNHTIKNFLYCTYCGSSTYESIKKGDFKVIISGRDEPEKVDAFVKEVLSFNVEVKRKMERTLIQGIDEDSAELIKKRALEKKLFFKTKIITAADPIFLLIERVFVFAFSAFVILMVLTLVASAFSGPIIIKFAAGIVGFFWFVSFGRNILNRFFKARGPIITAKKIESLSVNANQWMQNSIKPLLQESRSQDMNSYVAHLLEKFVILLELEVDAIQSVRDDFKTVLLTAIKLANANSELEFYVRSPKIFHTTKQLEDLIAQGPENQNQSSKNQIDSLTEELRQYSQIEEKYVNMLNLMILLQSKLNSLIGMALCDNVALETFEIQTFIAYSEQLQSQLEVSQDLHLLLEKAA